MMSMEAHVNQTMFLLSAMIFVLFACHSTSTAQSQSLPTPESLLIEPDESSIFEFGLDIRQRFEADQNDQFRTGVDQPGYWLPRLIPSVTATLPNDHTLHVELITTTVVGRRGGPRFLDKNELDLNQLKLIGPAWSDGWEYQLGRAEVNYGARRLIANPLGPNIRRRFDGVILRQTDEQQKIDYLAVFPVRPSAGIFDDRPNEDQFLGGVYRTDWFNEERTSGRDLYALTTWNRRAVYAQGVGEEFRTTLGARWFSKRGALSLDNEITLQLGGFEGSAVIAAAAYSGMDYKFDEAPFQPTLKLHAYITSGDTNRQSSRLQTYDGLFPTGGTFSELAPFGPGNMLDLRAAIDFALTDRVNLELGIEPFWRLSADDGVYNVGGVLRFEPTANRNRFTGADAIFRLTYRKSDRVKYVVAYDYVTVGSFIRDQNASDWQLLDIWFEFSL
ncbi:MAG TPA: hypothetical protein DDW52_05750 [Planctomycetaceae bacterium]|nr:hypothetical protein [Planctomycetaceae bacterium]